jgi:hypothetical protein
MTKSKKNAKKVGQKTNAAKTPHGKDLSEEQLENVAGGSFSWGASVGGRQPTPQECCSGGHFTKAS